MFWQQVERGHREDIPDELLADIRDMQVAKRLGVSVLDVRYRMPVSWIASALILQEAESINQEQQQKQAQRRSRRR
ncbi:MAG: hypothetical protein M3Q75_04790 [Gemmatimonadota bacterium]|nr:hypothetical protein [Gemmatimonadota bacterium]